MKGTGIPAGALPPFLTGAALAVVAEVAVGLLLYGGPGFIPALSVVLAVILFSLGAGLRVGARARRNDPVEEARRRWLLVLVAVSVGALFSGLWEVFQGFGARALTQGAGLALLAGLPMYGGGVILGTLQGSVGGTKAGGVGPPALVGAGVGVLGAGHLLFPALAPTAILLLCLMGLSAAALLHGRVLDRRVSVEPVSVHAKDGRGARVEHWIRGRPPRLWTAVLTGDRVRILVAEEGGPVLPEEALVQDGIPLWAPDARSILVLGGGCGGAARRLAEPGGHREVLLVDANGGLLEAVVRDLPGLAPDALGTLEGSVSEALFRSAGSLPPGPFDLVILEWGAGAVPGGPDHFPSVGLERLEEALGEGGVLVAFPLAMHPEVGEEGLLSLARDVAGTFPRTALYVARSDPGFLEQVPASRRREWQVAQPGPGERRAILVAGPDEGPPWPERIREFLHVPVGPDDREEGEGDASRPPL